MEKIKLLWAMLLEYKKDFGFKEHSHEYYQFFFIISGNNNDYMIINNKKIKLENNKFIFVKKNILHKMPPIKKESVNFIDVKFNVEDKKMEKFFSKIPETLNAKNEKILELLYDIKKYWREETKYSKEIITCQLKLFFLLILDEKNKYYDINISEKNSMNKIKFLNKYIKNKVLNSDEITIKLMDYLEKNYNKKISLEELEKKFFYSKEYLCRNFKKNTGWTIIYFFNYIKILEAIKQLKNMENTIESISENLHFSSSQYFCKTFKSFVGLTPNEFKRSQKKEIVLDELEHGKFDYRYKEIKRS